MFRSIGIKIFTTTAAVLSGLLAEPVIFSTHFPGRFLQPALAQTSPTSNSRDLLVNISTDDTWTANMAISMAHNALIQGASSSVTIFLNVRGVYLADQNRLPATEGNSDLNIHQKLMAFMEDGGTVVACPSCSQEAGLTQDDYIEGVIMGEAGGILPLLLSPNTAIISY